MATSSWGLALIVTFLQCGHPPSSFTVLYQEVINSEWWLQALDQSCFAIVKLDISHSVGVTACVGGSYLTLHRQNRTGRNTATAIVMGINQLSSDAYGSFILGPEVLANFCGVSWESSSSSPSGSPRSSSWTRLGGGRAGISVEERHHINPDSNPPKPHDLHNSL
jgi:hypothetical protein